MLREELKTVMAVSRIIAKEEIAAIPKPADPLENIESLIRKIVIEEIKKVRPAELVDSSKDSRKGGK